MQLCECWCRMQYNCQLWISQWIKAVYFQAHGRKLNAWCFKPSPYLGIRTPPHQEERNIWFIAYFDFFLRFECSSPGKNDSYGAISVKAFNALKRFLGTWRLLLSSLSNQLKNAPRCICSSTLYSYCIYDNAPANACLKHMYVYRGIYMPGQSSIIKSMQ